MLLNWVTGFNFPPGHLRTWKTSNQTFTFLFKNHLGHHGIKTPFLTSKLAGQYVIVVAAGLLNSTLQGLVKIVSPLMPSIQNCWYSVWKCNYPECCNSILASDQQDLLASFLLHASGFFFGCILSSYVTRT